MTAQDYGLARRMWHQLEPVHAVFWYAPEVFGEAAALGYEVKTRWPSYFAWRLAEQVRRLGGGMPRVVRPSCSWRVFRGLVRAGIRSGGGPHRRLPPSVAPGSRRTSSSRRRSTRDPPRR